MSTGAENACDFLKAFRTGWMTCDEVRVEAGVCDATARRWVHELHLQGFIVSRERAGSRGPRLALRLWSTRSRRPGGEPPHD